MSEAPRMSSHRPYLLRALYEWISDNDMTPHLLVDATQPGVRVPPHTINDGKVVLNIAARAVAHLDMDNDAVAFTARFGGVSHAVIVPVGAVLAIYARETGQGMALPPEDDAPSAPGEAPAPPNDDDTPPDDGGNNEPPKRGGHLRIVK
ncbi:MAG TPA: ClpXP protease specificity-enhancing factor [Luteimonas sp.]